MVGGAGDEPGDPVWRGRDGIVYIHPPCNILLSAPAQTQIFLTNRRKRKIRSGQMKSTKLKKKNVNIKEEIVGSGSTRLSCYIQT